jgi:hypothetical protein
MPCNPSARASKLSMLQEGNIISASNKARIAEYQKTIRYLQMQIDILDRENKVWDFCSIDETSMSGDGYYAHIDNYEESKDSKEKTLNGFHGDSNHQIHQPEDIYTGVFTGMEESCPTEEACSDKTSSSGSKASSSQRPSGKWHRLLIKRLLNRKEKENPGSFFYR